MEAALVSQPLDVAVWILVILTVDEDHLGLKHKGKKKKLDSVES